MERILITGASGNVGQAILDHFQPSEQQQLFRASRKSTDLSEDQLFFDFEKLESSKHTLQQIDTLFLLRPPQLANVKQYFEPLIRAAEKAGVQHILFLSVQGAESVSFIPHAKIEQLLRASTIDYTFIRPSYFMQNLSTTFLQDIREKGRIFLPAGQTPFLWVDVSDIGKAVAAILQDTSQHRNQAYTITGKERLNFQEVADLLGRITGRAIDYQSPNLIRFFLEKRRSGMSAGYIIVLIMLHYLPRFQKAPEISRDFAKLTGDEPGKLAAFMKSNQHIWRV